MVLAGAVENVDSLLQSSSDPEIMLASSNRKLRLVTNSEVASDLLNCYSVVS